MDTKPRSHDRSHGRSHHRDRDRGHTRSRSKSPSHHHHHHHRRRSHTHRHPRSHSRSRSRSPRRHTHRKHTRTPSPAPAPVAQAPLPFNAPPLTKHDLGTAHVRAIFSDYLDIQKGLYLDTLSTRELKGRYKRFVSHYNRGELARGWYERAVKEYSSSSNPPPTSSSTGNPPAAAAAAAATATATGEPKRKQSPEAGDSSEDEMVGPFLPGQEPHKRRKLGVARPTFDDLELQKEQTASATALARADVRFERNAERRAQSALLDELAPRADAGTHARRLEKKADITAKLSAFKDKSPGLEVDDATLMGGEDGGGTEGFKQKKAALERKKNDRELRKEQLLQARIAEREERMAMHRVKEERTMAMLRTLAGRFQ